MSSFTENNRLRWVKIDGYFKYEFHLSFQTYPSAEYPLGAYGTMTTGGDANAIYRYRPKSRDWGEHEAAEIQELGWEPMSEINVKWDSWCDADDEEYESD
ncbi:hypothetical protein [Medusavirus stheno T3]|uniref:Uncharacterized protein n=1 Tax=Medusavirus stheno T3 TaxID=3069717 RepID=A0A7S8BDB8_9VIRU|nr:hypothetical protein QKU73_gp090 [Acanthamoeba castellanii medusavirus]QPB44271.1 hypothetical protein [Medusavirus stheno T3]